VYTNCDSVRLLLNDTLIDEQESALLEQTMFTVPYKKGELTAIGFNSGCEAVRTSVKTTKKASRLQIGLSKETLMPDGFDAVVVNVSAFDEDGLFVPAAHDLVLFTVTGGAFIAGVGNGNQNSHEPDFADFRHLFNGRCQAVIKSDGTARGVHVFVSADKMESDEAIISLSDSTVMRFPSADLINTKIIGGWKMFNAVFDEMPDPNMRSASDDNNSFVPVTFDYNHQALLDSQYGKYALYRTEHDFPRRGAHRASVLCFNKVSGIVWIYINGELVKEADHRYGGRVEFDLPENAVGKQTVTVILRHMHEYWAHSGIYEPVLIKEYENK
jgi:beta-galactosidase